MLLPFITFRKAIKNYLARVDEDKLDAAQEFVSEVDSIYFDEDNDLIEVNFLEDYAIKTKININQFYTPYGIQCNCGARYCLHGIKALIFLDNLEVNSYRELNNPLTFDTTEFLSNEGSSNNKIKYVRSKEPQEKGFLFVETRYLSQIPTARLYNTNFSTELKLFPDDSLKTTIYSSTNYYDYESEASTFVFISKRIDGKEWIGMKCSCFKSNAQQNICAHLRFYLSNQEISDMLKNLMHINLSFERIAEQRMQELDLTSEEFNKHFGIQVSAIFTVCQDA